MPILEKILGPRHSIIVLNDHLDDEGTDEFRERIEAIRPHYRFTRLGEMVPGPGKRNLNRCAALVFRHPRKSLVHRIVPFLRSEEIPFTVFLRPDCIGVNRLPVEEELRLYADRYPEHFPPGACDDWCRTAWSDPGRVEEFLRRARREIGPLPVEGMDPTVFLATWGKLLEIPPSLIEFGLHVGADPRQGTAARDIAFIRQQTGVGVELAFSSQDDIERSPLVELGIRALVTPKNGVVEKKTDPWRLPCWAMERLSAAQSLST